MPGNDGYRFQVMPGCTGPHLQTLFPAVLRRYPGPRLCRERIELSDGDFLDLDWVPGGHGPLLLVLHGLAGCSGSNYVGGLLRVARAHGWRGVAMNFRGCSGEPNRHAKSYCAGDTADLEAVLTLLRQRHPDAPLFAVGYSLGGGVLLKWLGETASEGLLAGSVAVSVPFQLAHAARRMSHGWSRLYQAYLLRRLRRSYRRKFGSRGDGPVPFTELASLTDFWRFDDRVTAPLHGYAGVEDYYAQASCHRYLKRIRTPTLILHARDDPFMLPESVPGPEDLSASIVLELSERGGHVGFLGGLPWRPDYWLEQRIPAFVEERLSTPTEAVRKRAQSAPARLSR